MKASYLTKFLFGPLIALFIMLFVDLDPGNPMATRMCAVTAWIAIWWITEVVHLAVTSLLPFLLIPILGIAGTGTIAKEYMDPIMFLFIGGFILAIGIEHWHLHRRIALKILMKVGKRPSSILGGVMGVTWFFSMWISNTATVLMMMAAVGAVIWQMEKQLGDGAGRMASGLYIGLAYSATIGGMATLVGTPPNMVFYRFYEKYYPQATDMDFTQWFIVGLPVSVIFLVLAYYSIRFLFIPSRLNKPFEITYFKNEYKSLGPMSYEEKMIAFIFSATAFLWFTRSDIDFGGLALPGWKNLFPHPENIQDGTVAIAMSLLLFFIPSKNKKGEMLLSWKEASRLPFHILLLFGSGFALARGFEDSGLSSWLATRLSFMKDVDTWVLVLSICTLVCVISEFASNVASIQLMLPVLLPLVATLGVHPLLLMVPATFAASLGFMLPVATGPNTIVFGSNRIHVSEMARAGLALDVIGILLITGVVMIWN